MPRLKYRLAGSVSRKPGFHTGWKVPISGLRGRLSSLVDRAGTLFENKIFHARVGEFLARLGEQHHQYDPLDLFDVNVRRLQRQQPVNEDLPL